MRIFFDGATGSEDSRQDRENRKKRCAMPTVASRCGLAFVPFLWGPRDPSRPDPSQLIPETFSPEMAKSLDPDGIGAKNTAPFPPFQFPEIPKPYVQNLHDLRGQALPRPPYPPQR
jgi:hypothetical protein